MAGLSDARIARIRTSDRIAFRNCRRRWAWTSALRGNLTSAEPQGPLWMGTGVHFALEDFHGYKNYKSASEAFTQFVVAWKKTRNHPFPDDYKELTKLSCDMLDYYEHYWLENRDPLRTLWIDGKPQVEVHFEFDIPLEIEGYDRIIYEVTLDRVAIDDNEMLWPIDYKTAQSFLHSHLLTDPQISAYCWTSSVMYEYPVAGFIYQQHKKVSPQLPEPLRSGRYSVNKQQITSHPLYKEALVAQYGHVNKAHPSNIEFLNHLASVESESGDAYVRRDTVERNLHQQQAEGEKVLMEVTEMLNPDLPLYPTPNMFCGNCPFLSTCISIDDGSDWEFDLAEVSILRTEERDVWRKHLQ